MGSFHRYHRDRLFEKLEERKLLFVTVNFDPMTSLLEITGDADNANSIRVYSEAVGGKEYVIPTYSSPYELIV
jgi:hypothetical protein